MAQTKKKVSEEVAVEAVVEEKVAKPTSKEAVVNANFLNVRAEANKDAQVVGILPEGEKLTITNAKPVNGFYAVMHSTGLEGFVMQEFVDVV